ncbi:acyl-CoA dehydrogenase family protein [Micromonospora lutea]|uniref:Acyl-CoA dehydrogenase n=1 Tax=Micromonospora lutea TaxID=419825 RepID=A0ABQ4IYJ6_9ACTN|nr:acyl-CoA dehydrogenase family protein [Micromonospora lutea]GIJ22969.1 acyl-CoA dehydrogenase [Micromonospora lutea]
MSNDLPGRAELVRRASDLVPTLRTFSAWHEENRRIHDEAVAALAEAGVFRLRTPLTYGGYECDTRTLVDVAAELARGDGAAAWTASVYWIPTWMASHFPDHVQDSVFTSPDSLICGTLSPSAMASPTEGGIVVNGKWGFITGALHSGWQAIIAVLLAPEAEPMPVIALVPTSELQVVDDWHTAGLKGTGSVSTVARDLFVPQERFLPLGAILQGQGASNANKSSRIYQAPLLPVAAASSVGVALGLAKAALDAFVERLADRKITYTDYASQREAPITHLRLADAATRIDEAEFHAHRLAATVDRKAAEQAAWTMHERVLARADMGAAVQRAREAVALLADASGGSSIYLDVPIQRIQRDIQAMSLHALMHPDTNAELYGRLLSGLGPNSLYV